MAWDTSAAAFVGMGANCGERLDNLRQAVRAFDNRGGIDSIEASPIYETEAHTLPEQSGAPSYLNAVVRLQTVLEPVDVLDCCQSIERDAGRDRSREKRWGTRPLDLDVLAVGQERRQSARLTLPHPRLAQRRFVLRPWADLAPHFRVPLPHDATVAELLEACTDQHALCKVELSLSCC